jgi:mono/diheme cytochrome c family protein
VFSAWRRIICAAMSRPLPVVVCCLGLLAGLAAGCGREVSVPKTDLAIHHGAILFKQRCSGCHTLDAAAALGSRPTGKVSGGERTDGPNFNVRKETREDVLYAIRNGGFSGAIMPANVVVGRDAQDVAQFVSAYAGKGKSK